jgi:23S rRNA (uracil1939-C5)-methyltransferase
MSGSPKMGAPVTNSPKVGDVVETEVLRLARGGKAVGRNPDGRVLFVEGGVPGDFVRVQLTEVAARMSEGKIVEILKSSTERIKAPCVHADLCGGCPWQNVTYAEQIKQKQGILRDTLVRSRAISEAEANLLKPMIVSEQVFEYRSRITLQLKQNGGSYQLGYNKRGTHDFVSIESCMIADARLVPFAMEHVDDSIRKGAKLRERFQVALDEQEKLSIGGAFTQVNRPQNLKLQNLVKDQVRSYIASRPEILHWHLLDLYCGNGNLTFPTIEEVRHSHPEVVIEATGVEQSAESIQSAQKNPRAQLCRFYAEDVEHWLTRQKSGAAGQLTKKGLPLDEIIVLDPPRDGCDKGVMARLARRKPGLIVYVSCDPATLARDVSRLRESFEKQRTEYELLDIQGLDMFPQTDHIESMIVFRRKAN